MEIRNHKTNMVMLPQLVQALEAVRKARGFDANVWIEDKVRLLNAYYRQAGLKSAVVAVSGGIDSAVVLGLVAYAQQQPNSPIERIVAITMPDRDNDGVTGQDEAAILAVKVCSAFAVPPLEINMSRITKAIMSEVEIYSGVGSPGKGKEEWCRGQVTSYARTPAYYYVTSVLASQGQPGLVIGTTNLSEGGYLGYFGKASDGMVDVQLISDIYKSEVYEVGRILGVPQEVLDRAPTGDMFDATTDEVVFGAPYDFVELYQEYKRGLALNEGAAWTNEFSLIPLMITELEGPAREQWNEYADNLERMHRYNAHKYLGRSPAVHLDIMDCGVKTGWDNPAWRP